MALRVEFDYVPLHDDNPTSPFRTIAGLFSLAIMSVCVFLSRGSYVEGKPKVVTPPTLQASWEQILHERVHAKHLSYTTNGSHVSPRGLPLLATTFTRDFSTCVLFYGLRHSLDFHLWAGHYQSPARATAGLVTGSGPPYLDATVYGARQVPGQLAELTGRPEDLLRGDLVCCHRNMSSEFLRDTDAIYGVPEGQARRHEVDVVCNGCLLSSHEHHGEAEQLVIRAYTYFKPKERDKPSQASMQVVKDFKLVGTQLQHHYRIVDLANHVINFNGAGRAGKSQDGRGDLVDLFRARDDEQEAWWLARTVKRSQKEGIPLSQTAILYRCNFQSEVIEQSLRSAGIPYFVCGGSPFVDRKEIIDALAYLRLLDNPHDDLAFRSVINFPKRGIGERSVSLLQHVANDRKISLSGAVIAMSGQLGAKLRDFTSQLDEMRRKCLHKGLNETIKVVLQESGLFQEYSREDEKKRNSFRIANLEQLVAAGERFERRAWQAGARDKPGCSLLNAFIASLSLRPHEGEAGDRVQLMTVQSSMGLEFDQVFITGLEEGLFPHEGSLHNTRELGEERRLLYVAITSARKHLHISWAEKRQKYGKTHKNKPSSFLSDLPLNRTDLRIDR
eukprot:g946.t1